MTLETNSIERAIAITEDYDESLGRKPGGGGGDAPARQDDGRSGDGGPLGISSRVAYRPWFPRDWGPHIITV